MNLRMVVLGGALAATAGWAVPAQGQRAATQRAAKQAPRFEVDPMWPMPMPNRWILGSATGVAVDARDHIYVVHLTDSFNQRTESGAATNPPTGECCTPAPNVLEFDATGALVGHWGGPGQGYEWPTQNVGVAIDPAGNVWIGGAGGTDTRIVKFTRDGRFLAEFGKAGARVAAARPGAPDTAYGGMSPARGAAAGRGRGRGAPPVLPANSASMDSFGGASGFAFDGPANEAYVADGSRNHRIAVIDMTTGAIKRTWGAYGSKPDDSPAAAYDPAAAPSKQFSGVRCVKIANDGLVYVCDSQNDRIQVFKKDGSFVKEMRVAPNTRGAGSVWDIAFSRDPQQRYLYVADGMNMKVHILDRASLAELTAFGDGGRQPGQFYAVHSIATDSKGNVYTTETYEGKRVQKFNFKGVGPVTAANAGVVWPTRPNGSKP
jgi:DNA-binding beta-propeller fold protein YncE